MKKMLLGMLWGLLGAAVLPHFARGQETDWYRWRGPELNGISPETEWSHSWGATPKIAWQTDIGIGFSAVVVADGAVFATGFSDDQTTLYCIDAASGQNKWQYSYPATLDDRDFEGGAIGTPTVDGDRVYTLSRAGELFCLSTADGQLLWSKHVADEADIRVPGWGFAAAPLVVGSTLLVNVGEFGVAMDKSDGRLLWSSPDREAGYGTPVLVPDSQPPVAIVASARAYVGVNLETGEPLWKERWLTSFGCNAADAIVRDDQFLLSSGYNRGAALFRLVDGQPELVWKNKEMQNQLHSSILYQDHLYGIDGDMEAGARLKCIDWSTGEVRWSADDLRPGGFSLAGQRLIVLTDSGELVIAAADPGGYQELARGKVLDGKCWTVPVLSHARIYCRSVEGGLVCVDVH